MATLFNKLNVTQLKAQYIVTSGGQKLRFCPKTFSAESDSKEFDDENGCGRDRSSIHRGWDITAEVAGIYRETFAYLVGGRIQTTRRNGVTLSTSIAPSGAALPTGMTIVGIAAMPDGGHAEFRILNVSVLKAPGFSLAQDNYAGTSLSLYGSGNLEFTDLPDGNTDYLLATDSAEWNPVFEFDASRSGGSYSDAASVDEWNNLVWAGRDAFNGTVAQQPTFSASAFGNKGGITFDGTDDTLAWETGGESGESTLFLVLNAPDYVSMSIGFAGYTIATSATSEIGIANVRGGALVNGESYLVSIIAKGAGSVVRVNGVQVDTGTILMQAFNNNGVTADKAVTIGYMSAMNTELTLTELANKESALMGAFGIS